MPIRPLPPLLVNQIAAGEVIERPASVVKELVENSIDAGATRIDVAIEQGGRELVRVTDNGAGIPLDELPLALAAHATSKIAEAEDLEAIATMGFRGEALASIASVSRIAIRSRTAESDGAGLIEAEGDQVTEPRPVSGPLGTSVTVRNLFFNTPARRRFMKTERAEAGRVAEVLRNLALAHPEVGFTYRQDDRLRYDWAPEMPIRARVLAVLGPEMSDDLLEVDGREGEVAVWGLAGSPQLARATARHVHIFLNGRMIIDRTVIHAVREAYRGLIDPTRTPTVALYLEIDPRSVDVNVHPAKAEVRFRDSQGVHRAVRRAIKAALAEADLLPEISLGDGTETGLGPGADPPAGSRLEFGARDAAGAEGSGGSTGSPPATGSGAQRNPGPGVGSGSTPLIETAGPRGFDYDAAQSALAGTELPEFPSSSVPGGSPLAVTETETETEVPMIRTAQPYLQVHSSFIVTQDETGMLIIDQHALHERVMFEKLKTRMETGTMESQRLLVPAIVETDVASEEVLETLGPLLAGLGIEAEPMGPRTIAVHAIPSLLIERKVNVARFLGELVDRATTTGFSPTREAALHEILDMMSCKAAIKAGDRLSPEEISELLAWRERIERSTNCPHGRPTTLRLTIAELERRFGRS